jgi:hypothetical protein
MSLQDELVGLLPTKAARLVALATVPLAGVGFYLPHHLSPVWPKSTQAEIVLAQILLPALIGLVGSLVVLVLVLIEYHRLKALAQTATTPKPTPKAKAPSEHDIEPIRVRLLQAIVKYKSQPRRPHERLTTERLSSLVDIGVDAAEYHLTEMASGGYIGADLNMVYPKAWFIDHLGREYLVKRGLLN